MRAGLFRDELSVEHLARKLFRLFGAIGHYETHALRREL